MRKITRIIIHHTAGSTASGAMSHLNNVGLSYHDIIDENGKYISFRDYATVAFHAGNANSNSIGISIVGDFSRINAKPSQAQLDTLVETVKNIFKQFGELPIIHHSEVSNTACPVWNFKGYIADTLKAENTVKESICDTTHLAQWQKDFRDKAMELGISDGSRPLDVATRVEVMGMMVNFYNLLNKNGVLKFSALDQ